MKRNSVLYEVPVKFVDENIVVRTLVYARKGTCRAVLAQKAMKKLGVFLTGIPIDAPYGKVTIIEE